MKRNIFFAITILFTGILMLLRNMGIIRNNVSFFIVGLALLAIYILLGYYGKEKNILILIPSLILISLALWEFIISYYKLGNIGYDILLILFGFCFIIVYFVHIKKQNYQEFTRNYWPLFCALLIFILAIVYTFNFNNVFIMLRYLWPFILLSIGFFIFIGDYKEYKKSNKK
ncbi:hypothetical protein KQI89_09610 [Clostridium sp. MSJ-4]|uniref:DUF5668 domain-containing protein n=1 Tax=Clostridium simiarum TaxID=2841506 RepID=A0ABS6F2A9_9CLOT|nr:hypothetical protein [Clostridium simiarum]MBU5592025.1 hypothetical protein [Clostridium simiarum]